MGFKIMVGDGDVGPVNRWELGGWPQNRWEMAVEPNAIIPFSLLRINGGSQCWALPLHNIVCMPCVFKENSDQSPRNYSIIIIS